MAQPDHAHADIGIVSALPIEMSAFLSRCERVRKYSDGGFVFRGGIYDGVKIAIAESKVGFARARKATEQLIQTHTPNWILSCGLSGALQQEMKCGDIVVGDSLVDSHGQEIRLDINLPADSENGLYVGRLLTSDEMVRTVDEKRSLAESTQAIAVDMESLAVAQIAKERQTGFMAIRAISDDMKTDLPAEILSIIGSTGNVRIGAAIGSVWKRPGSVKDLWYLRENANRATAQLANFLDGVIKQLSGK
ncbi:MAG: 5'-methylthioadenosine nucleosidase [Planctomycetaceae bacterium]|nr:5'-methylthioadenosine nucleosidase [Planctomycetaceae bacterium]